MMAPPGLQRPRWLPSIRALRPCLNRPAPEGKLGARQYWQSRGAPSHAPAASKGSGGAWAEVTLADRTRVPGCRRRRKHLGKATGGPGCAPDSASRQR